MEYVSAIVASIATIIVALRAFFTGFTFDDRARERIMRDIKLFNALPDGFEQQKLKEDIEDSIAKMLDERERRERDLAWKWLGGAIVTGVLVTGILVVLPDDQKIWAFIRIYLNIVLFVVVLFIVGLLIGIAAKFWREKHAQGDALEQEALSPKS